MSTEKLKEIAQPDFKPSEQVSFACMQQGTNCICTYIPHALYFNRVYAYFHNFVFLDLLSCFNMCISAH